MHNSTDATMGGPAVRLITLCAPVPPTSPIEPAVTLDHAPGFEVVV